MDENTLLALKFFFTRYLLSSALTAPFYSLASKLIVKLFFDILSQFCIEMIHDRVTSQGVDLHLRLQ